MMLLQAPAALGPSDAFQQTAPVCCLRQRACMCMNVSHPRTPHEIFTVYYLHDFMLVAAAAAQHLREGRYLLHHHGRGWVAGPEHNKLERGAGLQLLNHIYCLLAAVSPDIDVVNANTHVPRAQTRAGGDAVQFDRLDGQAAAAFCESYLIHQAAKVEGNSAFFAVSNAELERGEAERKRVAAIDDNLHVAGAARCSHCCTLGRGGERLLRSRRWRGCCGSKASQGKLLLLHLLQLERLKNGDLLLNVGLLRELAAWGL